MQLYNALSNLGVVPDHPDGEVPPMLVMEGWAAGNGTKRPIFPPYARSEVEPELIFRGRTWEEFEKFV